MFENKIWVANGHGVLIKNNIGEVFRETLKRGIKNSWSVKSISYLKTHKLSFGAVLTFSQI